MSSEGQPTQYPLPVAPAGLGYVPAGFQPPPDPPRRGRRWLWLLAGVVAAGALVAGTVVVVRVVTRWDGRPRAGDTELTLRAAGPDGRTPDAAALDTARRLVLSRMTAAKLTRPTVTIMDSATLRVTVGAG
jgi:hypothetical protein